MIRNILINIQMSIDPTKTLGFETEEVKALCTDRDAIIYSLGIGYS